MDLLEEEYVRRDEAMVMATVDKVGYIDKKRVNDVVTKIGMHIILLMDHNDSRYNNI